MTFYAFPKEHWKHLRTTNVVESPFAAVRLRTAAAKRFKKVENATAVIWKTLLRRRAELPPAGRARAPAGGRRGRRVRRRSTADNMLHADAGRPRNPRSRCHSGSALYRSSGDHFRLNLWRRSRRSGTGFLGIGTFRALALIPGANLHLVPAGSRRLRQMFRWRSRDVKGPGGGDPAYRALEAEASAAPRIPSAPIPRSYAPPTIFLVDLSLQLRRNTHSRAARRP